MFGHFNHASNPWKNFQRIDDGWFASDFERSVFQGNPNFIKIQKHIKKTTESVSVSVENKIFEFLLNEKNSSHISSINKLAKIGATSLLINNKYDGNGLSVKKTSDVLKNISKINPVLSAVLGLMNFDSLTSIIHHFANTKQKQKFLPLISKAKLIPFLKTTSLYETLESQKSSIEGRIEKDFVNGKEIIGLRISFHNIILLGTSQSNCFYLNVNIKDFNSIHGSTTHLGTAICIINNEIKGLEYKKGLKAFDDYLYYFACSGNNIFIPFSHIINESVGIGNGLKYLYINQYLASSTWPLAVSIPVNNTATLTSWYYAHLQKQNGRQLLSYKVVIAKLNEQFSHCLKLQLIDNLSFKENLKFTAILNKSSHISKTMDHLGLLRGILGSNAHNIKTESNIRLFYKVVHLTTELDGMSYEINQLPLIKKAALACHPYYDKEVKLLTSHEANDLHEFDRLMFKHIGYILHNLTKIWAFTLCTSFLGKLFFQKNKYKYMIKRMSASFAFLSDIALINWAFKTKINTSFASHLGHCIQHLISSIAVHDYYINETQDNQGKRLAKSTLKNSLYDSQQSLKETANLAFNRFTGLFMKLLLFPSGKPFHKINAYQPLHSKIEDICNFDRNSNKFNTSFSPFLKKIHLAKQKLLAAESAEIAVTNATGTPLNTDNYEGLINRCLAAGIVSVEQSEQLRDAYLSILEIKITNHFGTNYEKNNDKK